MLLVKSWMFARFTVSLIELNFELQVQSIQLERDMLHLVLFSYCLLFFQSFRVSPTFYECNIRIDLLAKDGVS